VSLNLVGGERVGGQPRDGIWVVNIVVVWTQNNLVTDDAGLRWSECRPVHLDGWPTRCIGKSVLDENRIATGFDYVLPEEPTCKVYVVSGEGRLPIRRYFPTATRQPALKSRI